MNEEREVKDTGTQGKVRILYIEDNAMDREFVHHQLSELPEFHLDPVERFEDGMKKIAEGGVDLVLLDLNLPDAPGGLETFVRARREIPVQVPIVVFTSIDDERMGLSAVKKGAEDYLVKGHTSGPVLVCALRRAIEKNAEEGFFRTIVFCSPSAVVVADWDGKVRFVNPAAEKLFGKPAEEWVGRVFGHPIDPDRPAVILIPGGVEKTMTVSETEFHSELLYVLHFE